MHAALIAREAEELRNLAAARSLPARLRVMERLHRIRALLRDAR